MGPQVGPIRVDRTDGTLALPYSVTIKGHGTRFVGPVALSGDSGTVALGGQFHDAVAYEMQVWPHAGYTVYQTLAVTPDRFYVLWFYCKGTSLSSVYFEGTDGTPLSFEPASGTCSESGTPVMAPVHFPALDMAPPPLVTGYTIFGPDIKLSSSGLGHIWLQGTDWDLLVYQTLDCTRCGSQGWYELHSVLWDRVSRAGYIIIYLDLQQRMTVLPNYALTLPDLETPAPGTTLAATWTYADGYSSAMNP